MEGNGIEKDMPAHLYNEVHRGRLLLPGCSAISMGQGQEVHARRIISNSMTEGGWVLLQNCHLGLDYMDELLDTVTTAEPIHQSFRCWITTEVHPKFPINLLQVNELR